MTLSRARNPGIVLLSGLVVLCSLYGAWKALQMTKMNDGRISGMPLRDMPEMWFSGVLFVALVVAAAVLRPPTARKNPDGVTHRYLATAICCFALAIDVSKTSTLGFVMPGMRAEYHLGATQASFLAVSGLSGTLLGALAVRQLATHLGRREIYLISALGFTITSCCGTMPTFTGNLVMCFLMGIAVGGLAPTIMATVRDIAPAGRESLYTLAVGVLSTALGFLLAAGFSAVLTPTLGWRSLWLIGIPTGVLLAALSPFFVDGENAHRSSPTSGSRTISKSGLPPHLLHLTAGITGTVGFAVSTWIPTIAALQSDSEQKNVSLVVVALGLMPLAALAAVVYARRGARSLIAILGLLSGLSLAAWLLSLISVVPTWMSPIALVGAILAVNLLTASVMPIAADLSRRDMRTRSTASVSSSYRLGALFGPLLLAPLVNSVGTALIAMAVVSLICLMLATATRIGVSQTDPGPQQTPNERGPRRPKVSATSRDY